MMIGTILLTVVAVFLTIGLVVVSTYVAVKWMQREVDIHIQITANEIKDANTKDLERVFESLKRIEDTFDRIPKIDAIYGKTDGILTNKTREAVAEDEHDSHIRG
jgi:cell division protein FtsX